MTPPSMSLTTALDRLQTIEKAAEVLQLRPSTLRRWLRAGRVTGVELRLLDGAGGRTRRVVCLVPRDVLSAASNLV